MNLRDASSTRMCAVCGIRNRVLRHSVNIARVTRFASKCRSFESLSLAMDTIQMNDIGIRPQAHTRPTHTESIVQQSFKWIQMFVSAQPKKTEVKKT